MTNEQRLQKALAKIETRKQKQRDKGITEPSKFGYAIRGLIAPLFRCAVSLMYPRRGFVLLGSINRMRIKKLTSGNPVIYAPAHRSVWDAARYIAYALPHCYAFSGDEKAHNCTINEFAFEINGVISFDRDDKKDCEIALKRSVRVLKRHKSLLVCPEGVPNVYSRNMLKLYPGIIKMALETNAIIVPIGNEIHILRDKLSKKIIGDVSYMMYEDYNHQPLSSITNGREGWCQQMHDIILDKEFMMYLPKLDKVTYEGLERQILQQGARDPLVSRVN
jgi:hypothetical protein